MASSVESVPLLTPSAERIDISTTATSVNRPGGDVNVNGVNAKWTFVLLLKTYIGSGILGLPFAYSVGGVFASNVATVVCAAASFYAIILLLEVKDTLPTAVDSLELIAANCFGTLETRSGRVVHRLVKAIVCFTQLGFSTAYLIFVSKTIASMFPDGPVWQVYVGIVWPLFVATLLIKDVGKLGFVALFGFAAIFSSICYVIVYCVTSKYDDFLHGTRQFALTADPETLPVMFGMCVGVLTRVLFRLCSQTHKKVWFILLKASG